MKKALFLLVALTAASAASAQLVVGGLIGFEHKTSGYTTQGFEEEGGTLTNGNYFFLSARVGFAFGNYFELGVKPNADFSLYIYQTGTYSDDTKKWEALTKFHKDWFAHSVAPYARLKLLHFGSLSLIADVTADLAWERDDIAMPADASYPLWSILLTPVANLALGDHFSFDVYLNMLTLGYSGQSKAFKLIHTYQEAGTVDPMEFGVSASASRGTLVSAGLSWKL